MRKLIGFTAAAILGFTLAALAGSVVTDALRHIGAVELFSGTTPIGTNSNPLSVGYNTNNTSIQPHVCGSHVYKHITTATDTEIVGRSGSTNIYVCDYSFSANAANNVYLEKSTSGTCAGLTQIDQTWYLTANQGKTNAKAFYSGLNAGASNSLCVNTSQAVNFDVAVDYDRY